jgi:hypothetical protein
MPDSNVRFVHIRDDNPGTTAFRVLDDGLTVEMGFAYCSRDDNFNKAKGRLIAEGRLNAKRNYYAVAKLDAPITQREVAYLLKHGGKVQGTFTAHFKGNSKTSLMS